MTDALRAEFTKLRTLGNTGALLLGLVAAVIGLGWLVAATTGCPPGDCREDPVRLSLTGVQLGQVAVVVLATGIVGGEYGTGLIRVTLAAVPRRTTVVAAKALLLSAAVAVAGSLAVPTALLAGHSALAVSLPSFSLTAATTLRALGGSIGYLVLIGLLGLGVALLVRRTIAALGVTLSVLYLFPLLAATVGDQDLAETLNRLSPLTAGLSIQATTDLSTLPIGPWPGLGVLAVWAAAAMVAGTVSLRLRNA